MITPSRLERLNRIYESYDMVAEGTDVYVCDIKYDYSRWSKNSVDIYGLPSEYMYSAGDIWEKHIHPDDKEAYRSSIEDIFQNGKGMHDMQYRAMDQKGKYYMCTCRGIVIFDDNKQPEYFVGMIRNHSINKSVDNITGLRNQNGFLYDIDRYLANRIPIKIVMYGSTNFTRINDLFGYDFGTRFLQHCTRFMLDNNKNLGNLYRLDGARIALISRNASIEQLKDNYDFYKDRLSKSIEFENEQLILNINAGAVSVDSFDVSVDTILSCLTQAYHESKYNYQGEFCYFENGLNSTGIDKLERINRIRNSVVDSCSDFTLYYQPIVNAKTDKIYGAEALIRWVDSDGNIVMPNDFIPVLENDALFPALGEWILRQAMQECLSVIEKYKDFVLNVNLSYAQLQNADFLNVVKRALDDIGFPTKNLCLEITERCRFLDRDLLRDISFKLRSMGIKVALDDFGTGFSSLEILQILDIDVIKIDRAFIKNIVNDPKQNSLVKLVNKIAEIYDAYTCVEGVENIEMRDIIKNCDVATMQGYLYSKPISFGDFCDKYL